MTTKDDIDDSSAPLIEHLAELRNRILYSLAAFVVGMVLCFTVWNPIFNFLTHPICDALSERQQDCGLVLIKLQEGFFVAVRMHRHIDEEPFALALPLRNRPAK